MLQLFADRVVDMMAASGSISNPVQQRKMFGGSGLFSQNLMFAIAVNDQLYLKADSETRRVFESRGLERFSYQQNGQTFYLDFYHAPAEVFSNSNSMTQWVQQALMSAERAQQTCAA